MEVYMDEKWKLSKKGSRSGSCRRELAGGGPPLLKASASVREGRRSGGSAATAGSLSRRCAGLVKEQKARFYIMRRCVTMLICWRDYP